MPITPTYPGVYIEEIPSGVHTIVGVATSITAFLGKAPRGPANRAVHILSPKDYDRRFGGLSADSEMSYAVSQFFLNGGTEAWVVRLAKNAKAASVTLKDGSATPKDVLTITALDEGTSGNKISLQVIKGTADPTHAFDHILTYAPPDDLANSITETYQNLSMVSTSPRFVEDMINDISQLVKVKVIASPGTVPNPPAEQKPTAGSLTSGTINATDVDTLVDDKENSLQISFDQSHFTNISIGKGKAKGADLATQLGDIAARIQKAVQNAKPGLLAWINFTCTVANGNQLVLTSGVTGGKAIQVKATDDTQANNIADALHLVTATTNGPTP